MYSTTTLVKNSKFSGRIVGTHQQLDEVARKTLRRWLPRSCFFPSDTEIIHFEGTRGPDGLKRKSPGIDEPSHMMTRADLARADAWSVEMSLTPESSDGTSVTTSQKSTKTSASSKTDQRSVLASAPQSNDSLGKKSPHVDNNASDVQSDSRSVVAMIQDHYANLVAALQQKDKVRAAFEAAWMAHMVTDGLTPAHHFPLSDVKDELMAEKEMMRVFGQPVKGVMHGRSMLETMRNNWLYWGAKGHMTQHVAYEYGVAVLAATLPQKTMMPELKPEDFQDLQVEANFFRSLQRIRQFKMYDHFRENGWTTELAFETKNTLLPEIVKAITLSWYAAATEAYQLEKPSLKASQEA